MSGLVGEELIYVLGLLAHGEGVVQLSSSVSSLARSLSLPPTVWLFFWLGLRFTSRRSVRLG